MSEAPPRAPRWAWWVATGFGSGYLKPAPGTWGSLAGLAAWLLLVLGAATPLATWALGRPGDPWAHAALVAADVAWLGILAALTGLAVHSSGRVAADMNAKDPACIVIDEWAGLWIALHPVHWVAARHAGALLHPDGALAFLVLVAPGFLCFRLFDIWKPWPCYALQDLPGGRGIVADDLVAGLYAALVSSTLAKVLFPGIFFG